MPAHFRYHRSVIAEGNRNIVAMPARAALVLTAVFLCTDAGAKDIYACVDAKGMQRKSDRPIPECSDREQRVLGAGGTVKRVVPPAAASSASQPQRGKASAP
jgi:hypothetical protein